MNWRQEYRGKCAEARQRPKAVSAGIATPRAEASIANPDSQIQEELESFAMRSHALERKAAVCARVSAATEKEC